MTREKHAERADVVTGSTGGVQRAHVALVVVDMQNDFLQPEAPMKVPGAHVCIEGVKRAAEAARAHGLPVMYTKSTFRGDRADRGQSAGFFPQIGHGDCLVAGSAGAEIHAEVAPQGDDLVVCKHRYSAFYGTDLEILLDGLEITTVVIAGVTTENCCHATARDAMFRGYEVVVLSDATAALSYPSGPYGPMTAEEVQAATLNVLSGSTGAVISTAEFVRDPRLILKQAFPV